MPKISIKLNNLSIQFIIRPACLAGTIFKKQIYYFFGIFSGISRVFRKLAQPMVYFYKQSLTDV